MKPNSHEPIQNLGSALPDDLAALGDQLRRESDLLAASYPATDKRIDRPSPAERSTRRASWTTVAVSALASLLVGVLLTSSWHYLEPVSPRTGPGVAEVDTGRVEAATAPARSQPVRIAIEDEPSVDEVLRSLAGADVGAPDHSEIASPEEKIRILEDAVEGYRSVILYQQGEIRRLLERIEKLESNR